MKKILVIGNGGRENAIIEAFYKSPQAVEVVNLATGINPGIQRLGAEIIVGDIMDCTWIKEMATLHNPHFALVGPDDPIGIGAVDALLEVGIKSFAPLKICAQLESSKSFTRNLCARHQVPGQPGYLVSARKENKKERRSFFDQYQGQIVVKADGLLGGKGVIVADDHFTTFAEAEDFALKSIEKFGRVVLEERLLGEEFSLISLVDGLTALDTPAIQDHKRAFEDDEGPNTGGMGCIADENHRLPFLNEDDIAQAHDITVQTMKAVKLETGQDFIGVMYGGFMKTKDGIKLIEYNARFGDPEAFNILPIMETDFVEVCEKAIHQDLKSLGNLKFKPVATVVKYLCPEGYPENSVKNVPIEQLQTCEGIYFASVTEESGKLMLKGSRAIGILGTGSNFAEALHDCESKIKNFTGPLFYRQDIGTPHLIQKRMDHMAQLLPLEIKP